MCLRLLLETPALLHYFILYGWRLGFSFLFVFFWRGEPMSLYNWVFWLAHFPSPDDRLMNKKHRLNGNGQGNQKYSGKNLYNFVHHKSHMDNPQSGARPPRSDDFDWPPELRNGLKDYLTSDCSGNVKTQSTVVFKNKVSLIISVLKNLNVKAFQNLGELLKFRHNLWGGINNL